LATLAGTFSLSSASDEREALSERDAQRILRAAEGYFEEGGKGCPTLTTLKQDEHLDPVVPSSDAWGQRFRVSCKNHALLVQSAGPDRQLGSADDVKAARQSG
jgi:hypothetical protein